MGTRLRAVRGVLVLALLAAAAVGCGTQELGLPRAAPAAGGTAGGTAAALKADTATTGPAVTSTSTTTASAPATASAQSATTAAAAQCPQPDAGFDCDFQRRFTAAQAYVRQRPGTVGIVVRDRQTGAVWRDGYATKLVWTASTVKLAMTVDLLLRDRAGTITLSAEDRALIEAMLHSSDDNAADTLWSRYGRDGFATRFPRYGLTSITFVQGFPRYWGFMKCTPDDLDRLINYVLAELPAELRDYVVGQMRAVASNQRWGVWGAGPAATPGNKNGWSLENTGWVMNSVGFVGPGERYTMAVMNDLHGNGGYDQGRATDTEVARLIFAGRF
ncbi:MAG TPA: serine hydrolase [Pseudonocardiaceae bacterium]